MCRPDYDHEVIARKFVEGEMGRFLLAAGEPDMNLAALDHPDDGSRVSTFDAHAHFGMASAKISEDAREQMIAGDGTGAKQQFASDDGGRPADGVARFVVQRQNASGKVVQRSAGFGERDSSGGAAEDGDTQSLFELLYALTDGRLRHT